MVKYVTSQEHLMSSSCLQIILWIAMVEARVSLFTNTAWLFWYLLILCNVYADILC